MARRTVLVTAEERAVLTHYRDHDREPWVRERCSAVLKIADGQAPYAVARTGLLQPRDPDTVYSWLTCYATEGIAGLLAHQHGGPRRRRLRHVA